MIDVLADDCLTAAQVLKRAAKVQAFRNASRAPIPKPLYTAPKEPNALENIAFPSWVGELVHGDEPTRPITIYRSYPRLEDIVKIVARYYEISTMDIYSSRRTAKIVLPRQIAAYLAKTLTPRSLPEIGRRLGGRDHTTILHAVRKIDRLLPRSPLIASDLESLKAKISDHMAKYNGPGSAS